MRIASRGGVSYRRIISATEARRAFSPIRRRSTSFSLYFTRIFPATDRSFCLSPPPRDAATTTAPSAFDLLDPFLLECSFFLLESLWFVTLWSDCFHSSMKNNKSHGIEKRMRERIRELNSLIGYRNIFCLSFFLSCYFYLFFFFFEEGLIKYWIIFISMINRCWN